MEAHQDQDQDLLAIINSPKETPWEITENESFLEILGRKIFEQFVTSNNYPPGSLSNIELALEDVYRIRLQLGSYTLWLYDFEAKDEWGSSGKSSFMKYASLPRHFMPIIPDATVRTTREY